jgi:cobalt/nickel transport system permease protein
MKRFDLGKSSEIICPCITHYYKSFFRTIKILNSNIIYLPDATIIKKRNTDPGDPMHIPDGFFPISQAAVYWIIALVFILLSLRWAKREMSEDKVPLVAVLAAGIFAIQTLNMALPISIIPGGVSGHVVGAALAAIVLGSPFAAIFILTLVLVLQGIFFGDGGITAMGANIINMGVLGGFFGFYTYQSVNNLFHNHFCAAFVAGWISLFIPAVVCAVELALAGTLPLTFGLVTMGIYHAVIGIIEGGITAFALSLIFHARPDIISGEAPSGTRKAKDVVIIAGITIALAIAICAPYYASTYPDGLDSTFLSAYGARDVTTVHIDEGKAASAEARVAEKTGNTFSWQAPLPDYSIPGLEKPGEVMAILFGVLVLFFLGFGISRFISRKN